MSRKEASFGQLIDYIDRDGGEEKYRIRYNLLGRDQERIREEFEQNAARMSKRKNGVWMYHEIISLTRARNLSLEQQKERLHKIAQEYIAMRAPDNMCYGGLHDDKDHSVHYHIMISANRCGEGKRHRLSKKQFRNIQIGLEKYVLAQYPELEQKVAIDKVAETRIPKDEAELKRRGGKRNKREAVTNRIKEAIDASRDRDSLLHELNATKLEFYVRGKNIGVLDRETGKRHRVKTLDAELIPVIEARMQHQEERQESKAKASTENAGFEKSGGADEKEKQASEKTVKDEPEDTLSEAQHRWKQQDDVRRKAERTAERKKERGDDFER